MTAARLGVLKRAGERSKERSVRVQHRLMNVNDFTLLQVIGAGAFGVVRLCQRKDTGEVFALKQISKTEMIRRNKVCHVLNEKEALRKADNDWVISLHCTFQDSAFLYMVMDYLPGGDLMTHLQRKGKFTEEETRFYIGELVQAVDYIHTVLRVVHRDIKPDNVVLDAQGHVRVVDFGLSSREADLEPAVAMANGPTLLGGVKAMRQLVDVEKRMLVGTPDYAAPEAYLQLPCDRACDWWSVGVVAYEMLFGRTPFADEKHDPRVIAFRVMRWRQYLLLPHEPNVGGQARALVKGLLCDKQDRLASAEIRAHPFFKDLKLAEIRSMEPPVKPLVRGPLDTSNFDDFTNLEVQMGFIEPDQVSKAEGHSALQNYDHRSEQNQSGYSSEPRDGTRTWMHQILESMKGRPKEAAEQTQPLVHWLADLLAAPALVLCSPLRWSAPGRLHLKRGMSACLMW